MFGFFGDNRPTIKIIDRIWMATSNKYMACKDMQAHQPDAVFLTWFEESNRQLKEVIEKPEGVRMVGKTEPDQLTNRMVIFVEHYPLPEIELTYFEKLKQPEIPVLSALDEPFFQLFGGDRLVKLMDSLGLEEGEAIGHKMITKAIQNAQKKIASKVKFEKMAASQKEWFSLNLND